MNDKTFSSLLILFVTLRTNPISWSSGVTMSVFGTPVPTTGAAWAT